MHAIRLRGPWEFSVPGTPVTGRIEFPCSWLEMIAAVAAAAPKDFFLANSSTIRLLRRFNKPTGLAQGDRVLLTFRPVGNLLTAQLNGSDLAISEQVDECRTTEITSLLSQQNELVLALEPPCPAPLDSAAPIMGVTLEIHATA